MTGSERAGAMARRLAATGERVGMSPAAVSLLLRAFSLAVERRHSLGLDDHHPDYLHPARTALILMDDAGVADGTTLAAATLCETRDSRLAVDPERVPALDGALSTLLQSVPSPRRMQEAELIETLVTAPAEPRLVALAERLDHARHLHLRDRHEWAGYHALSCRAYRPVADRTHPVLARRWDWWCRSFEDRFLTPSSP